MHNVIVKSVCDRKTISGHFKKWLSEGYRLVAVSKPAQFSHQSFTVEDLVKTVENGICVYLTNDDECVNITISHTDKVGTLGSHSGLKFGYITKSYTIMKKPLPVRLVKERAAFLN